MRKCRSYRVHKYKKKHCRINEHLLLLSRLSFMQCNGIFLHLQKEQSLVTLRHSATSFACHTYPLCGGQGQGKCPVLVTLVDNGLLENQYQYVYYGLPYIPMKPRNHFFTLPCYNRIS